MERRLIMFVLKRNTGLNIEIIKAESILICAWSYDFIAVIIRTAACSEGNFFEQKCLGPITCLAVNFSV